MSSAHEEQQALKRARAIVARSNELFDRLGEVWDTLSDEEQVELVERVEKLDAERQ